MKLDQLLRKNAKHPRLPGDFFKQITGKSVTDCSGIEEIDAAVAQVLGKKSLELLEANQSLVSKSGDVFGHIFFGGESCIDKQIDAALNLK
jgi:hypothetical protein